MALVTKALNQISIIDLTDGYSVDMARSSGSFNATKDTKTAIDADTIFATTITALQGSENITDLKIGTCTVRGADGESITYTGAAAATAPITVTTTDASTSGGTFTPATVTIHVYGAGSSHTPYAGDFATVEIPVYVEGAPGDSSTEEDIIITKVFSISAALAGEDGQNTYIRYSIANPPTQASDVKENPTSETLYLGIATVSSGGGVPAWNSNSWKWSKFVGEDGTPGIDYYISSSNGWFFKNTSVNTILTIHGRDSNLNELTEAELKALGTIKWFTSYNSTTGTYGDEIVAGRNQISITVDNSLVTNTTTFYAVVEVDE